MGMLGITAALVLVGLILFAIGIVAPVSPAQTIIGIVLYGVAILMNRMR